MTEPRNFDEVILEILAEIDATVRAIDTEAEANRIAIQDYLSGKDSEA